MPRAAVRSYLVMALLFGLFLMHGSATGAGGCDEVPAHHSASEQMPMPMMGSAAKTMVNTSTIAGVAVSAMIKAGASMAHGSLCLAYQLRSKIMTASAAGALLVYALAALLLSGVRERMHPSRAPPIGGSALLTRLCISRT